jgi:hypothetical protein
MVVGAPIGKSSVARRQFIVRAHRDTETGGWWADSDDVPGLVTEAATYDELVDRVLAVVPDLCKANDVAIADGDLIQVRREAGARGVTKEELDRALSELGGRIWNAVKSDDSVSDLLYELVEAKLTLDGVDQVALALADGAALAIFDEREPDNPRVVRPKEFVRSSEWTKNSHYNLALQWVFAQAIARMQLENRFPSDAGKSDVLK